MISLSNNRLLLLLTRKRSFSTRIDWKQLPWRVSYEAQPSEIDLDASKVTSTRIEANEIRWKEHPQTVLLVKKHNDNKVNKFANEISQIMKENYPQCKLLCEESAANDLPHLQPVKMPDITEQNFVKQHKNLQESIEDRQSALDEFESILPLQQHPTREKESLGDVIDAVIALGGDGTMLHISSLFPKRAPPVLFFGMGTLSFLAAFKLCQLKSAIDMLFSQEGFKVQNRQRLDCEIVDTASNGGAVPPPPISIVEERQPSTNPTHADHLKPLPRFLALNEVSLVRGSPGAQLVYLDVHVNDEFITNSVGDGLIISSSTGSTGYSLSCNGPMVHPAVRCLLVTPVCPRSLSFRPVVLPDTLTIAVQASPDAHHRNAESIVASFDGRNSTPLGRQQRLVVKTSPFPLPTITMSRIHTWLHTTRDLLKWNENPAASPIDYS